MRFLYENLSGKKICSMPGAAALALLAVILVFVSVFAVCDAGSASAETGNDSPRTVRVGYFNNGDFMHQEKDGTYAGYDIEYYYMVAEYADWKIKIRKYASLDDALSALYEGKIDVLSGLSKTPERSARYISSNLKMCTSQIAVQTREDDDRFTMGDPSTMKNMKCGILKKSNVVDLYSRWCRKNGISPHIVQYEDLEQRNKALAAGEVDAIAAGSTIRGAQKIAEFPSLDLYFMFNRNRKTLKAEMDKAMAIMTLQNPAFAQDLFKKYFPASRNDRPSFSKKEKKFIAAHKTIKIAVMRDDQPFSKEDAAGKMSGILPDYCRHISRVTGMHFQLVPYDSAEEACSALRAGKVDIDGKTENDVYHANEHGIIISNPYIDMNLVRVTRAGTKKVSSAGTSKYSRNFIAGLLRDSGMTLKLKSYKNNEKCFAALKSKKVDSIICVQPAATWLLNQNRLSEYVVSSFGSETNGAVFGMGFSDSGNMLRSIINKTIAVDGGYINQLITKDTLAASGGVQAFVNRMPVSLIVVLAAIAVLLLIITAAALIVIVRRRSAEREIASRRAELAAADEANKARHMFFGNVSHDMRTPLNGIVGFADIAMQSDDIDEIKGYLAKIRRSSSTLSDLVNDTLIMSRMMNGKYIIEPVPCELPEIFEEIMDPIRSMAEGKHITISDDLQKAGHACVMADRLSLQKILLNLLVNAVKFTPEGGSVDLGCSIADSDGGRKRVIIRVADTGIGISEDFRKHIFEPFAQEDPVNARSAGSGMGLSIVKGIVDAMDGDIQAEPNKDRGTLFTVKLLLDGCRPVQDQGNKGPDEAEVSQLLAGRRALVCEDNALNMEILRTILERAQMEVDCAENGRTGVDLFEKSPVGYYDFVLLDLRMPVMDGNAAARALRKLDRADAGNVPVIAVSADTYQKDIDEAMAAGMNGHVAKPVNADILLHTLAEFAAGRSSGTR